MSWIMEECESSACEEAAHPYPEPGTHVMVSETVETYEPGGPPVPFIVKANEVGVVISYVPEWHDVEVALASRDGQRAWIAIYNLEGPA